MSDAAACVAKTRDTIDAAAQLEYALLQTEKSWHEYALTRDESALQQYRASSEAGARRISEISRLTADNPDQQRRVDELSKREDARQALIGRAILLARMGDPAKTLVLPSANDAGPDYGIAASTEVLDRIVAEEQILLLQRRDRMDRQVRRRTSGLIASLGAAAIATLLGGLALIRMRRTAAAGQAERDDLMHMVGLASVMVRDFSGQIRYWPDGCQRLYGWSAAEAIGRNSHELLQTTFSVPRERIEATLLEKGEWVGELRHRTRSGAELIVRVRKVLRRADGVRPLRVTEIITDITPLVQAEQALRESAAQLRLVQQIGGIASAERTTSEAEARFSEPFRLLYGLSDDQRSVAPESWLELIHTEDRPRVEAGLAELQERPGTIALQFRIERRDGTERWIAMRAESFAVTDENKLRTIGAHQDITELVAAREALAARGEELERQVAQRTAALGAAEARFRAIFDSQFQFITVIAPDGTVLEANHAVSEATGVSPGQTIGTFFWDALACSPVDRDWLRAQIEAAAQGTFVRRELELCAASGRPLIVDFSLKPVRERAGGAVEWIIAEGRDITDRRDLSTQLAQAQKVQALGQLAGGIAHDFNNILQSISGAASLMSRRPAETARVQRLTKTVIDAAARGASITQRLLSFARRGHLSVEALPVAEIVDGVREVLEHALGSTIAVRTVVPEGLPPVLSDRGQLETALVNLGTNARDSMARGGTLAFSVTAEHIEEHGDGPAGLAAGDYIRIDVSDTGSGMTRSTLSRVFEPFFTTKPEGMGTGLGLPMVKGFVEQTGGTLAIESALGVGTTVSLWLPQAIEDATTSADDAGSDLHTGAAARVLLVDDDDLVRETMAAQLECMGFEVIVASGGAEAVALVESGEAPDAMVSDLSMPYMNGIETIRRARAMRPGMPCFLVTGYVGDRAVLEAGDTFTLIRKPVSASVLAAGIEAAIEAARGRPGA